jgi:hypothetical protein
MPGLAGALAADPVDDVVGGDAGRLVDQQACPRSRLGIQSWERTSSRRNSTTCG